MFSPSVRRVLGRPLLTPGLQNGHKPLPVSNRNGWITDYSKPLSKAGIDMIAVIKTLLPICALVGLGLFLHQRHIITQDKWDGVEKLCYWLFFPAILAETLITSDLKGIPLAGLTATLFCSVLTMTTVMLALKPVLTRYGHMEGPAYTTLFQVSTRWNPSIALAIILKLFGAPGVALVAVAMVAMIPLINI